MPNRLLMTGNTTKLQDNHFCTFGHLQLTNTHTFVCVCVWMKEFNLLLTIWKTEVGSSSNKKILKFKYQNKLK